MNESKLLSYKKEIKNNKEIIKTLKKTKTKKELNTILSRLQ
tara:strand:+ start:265 stop:387 length:123 start_codon:yes stop_codon:yes gene_type:complete